jgi:hypothetical protein
MKTRKEKDKYKGNKKENRKMKEKTEGKGQLNVPIFAKYF